MPDITMCKGTDCPLKERCFRYKATPSYFQSWFVDIPFDKQLNNCNQYWEVISKSKIKRLDILTK